MTCKLPMWNRERKYTEYENEELTYYECKLLDNSDIHWRPLIFQTMAKQ